MMVGMMVEIADGKRLCVCGHLMHSVTKPRRGKRGLGDWDKLG